MDHPIWIGGSTLGTATEGHGIQEFCRWCDRSYQFWVYVVPDWNLRNPLKMIEAQQLASVATQMVGVSISRSQTIQSIPFNQFVFSNVD